LHSKMGDSKFKESTFSFTLNDRVIFTVIFAQIFPNL
jgi:hypothetical protein